MPVGSGGTGNNTSLTNGQLWIGNTGNVPTVGTLTNGTNIAITNGAGTITIASTATSSITWNDVGSVATVNMSSSNGYHTVATAPNFYTGSTAAFGDMYYVQQVGNGGFVFNTLAGQGIEFGGSTGTHLTTTDNGAAATLLCSSGGIGTQLFTLFSTNGATFTLS